MAGSVTLLAAVVLGGCGGSDAAAPTTTSGDADITYQVVLFTDDGEVVGLDDGTLWAVAKQDQQTVVGKWNLDSQLVGIGDGGHELVDRESGGAHSVAATKLGTVNDRRVYEKLSGVKTLTGIGHGAYFAGGADGSVLTLGDGSVWEVSDPNDQEDASGWADGDNVKVAKGDGGAYTLDDTDVASFVSANYIGQASGT